MTKNWSEIAAGWLGWTITDYGTYRDKITEICDVSYFKPLHNLNHLDLCKQKVREMGLGMEYAVNLAVATSDATPGSSMFELVYATPEQHLLAIERTINEAKEK